MLSLVSAPTQQNNLQQSSNFINRNLSVKIRGIFDPGLTTHSVLTTQIFIESPSWTGQIFSRYLRSSSEKDRWGHEIEEGEGFEDRLSWVVRKGLWGEELDVSLGWEGTCHVKTGKKRFQRNSNFEQPNDGHCGQDLVIQEEKGRLCWDKIILGLNS